MTNIQVTYAGQQQTITSLEVAEMVGREHNEVLKDLRRIIANLEKSHIKIDSYFHESEYTDSLNRKKPMYMLTKQGCDLYGKRLTGDAIIKFYEVLNRIIGNSSTFVVVQPDRLEVTFFAHLSEALKPFGITFETQYLVLGYKIDAYIEGLKIAIEYDERQHKYQKEKDIKREKEIQEELGCRFIRISSKESNAYNIGKVIKDILG